MSQAVSVMNFHQDVKAKQEAAKWLEHFQTSPLAWQVNSYLIEIIMVIICNFFYFFFYVKKKVCHVILTNAAVEAMQTDPLLPYVVYFAAQSLRTKIGKLQMKKQKIKLLLNHSLWFSISL